MARFKVNETVIIKENGKKGVVKGIEKKHQEKHTDITYVVRSADGEWKMYTRKEISKLPAAEVMADPYITIEANNGWRVLVTAIRKPLYYEEEVGNNKTIPHSMGVELYVGFSIFNPADIYDEEHGLRIARYRAKQRPLSAMYSANKKEFGRETITAILRAKGEYIVNNLDKFAFDYEA